MIKIHEYVIIVFHKKFSLNVKMQKKNKISLLIIQNKQNIILKKIQA